MVEISSTNIASSDTTILAASTAFNLDTIFSNLKRNFMLKNLKTICKAVYTDTVDMPILVLGATDASVAEIAEALATTAFDPEDSVSYNDGQTKVRRVWDIQPGLPGSNPTTAGTTCWEIKWKLPPKGIPILKGRGISIYAFNMDTANAFANGPIFTMVHKAMGGWF